MVDLPAPDAPTSATVLPAGTSKFILDKVIVVASYENSTFWKFISPPSTFNFLDQLQFQ